MKSFKAILPTVSVIFLIIILPACNKPIEKKRVSRLCRPSARNFQFSLDAFPGPCLPFGMVKLSPDNTDEGLYKLGAGYEYKINSISGFGHVHSWMMGSFITMPTTGELKIKSGTADDPDSGYRSRINNEKTKASAGYYSTVLEDYNILAELTATTRGGFQRYTFPKTENGRVLFDFQVTEEEPSTILEAEITKVSDTEIEGYLKREAGEWNEYTLHFVAQFNRPFKSMGGWTGFRYFR